jgi:hypothetical protein
MNDLSVQSYNDAGYEIDRVLALLTPVQLQDHKQTLREECNKLAKQHIEAASNFCIDSIVRRYEYKKDIIRRISIQENVGSM